MTREALNLLRDKRASEIYINGEFMGIVLNYVVEPMEDYLLAPAELPGLHFDDPAPERKYARFHWSYV
jgi:hypothetical protein